MKKELKKLEAKLEVAGKKKDFVGILKIRQQIDELQKLELAKLAYEKHRLELGRVDMKEVFAALPREVSEGMITDMNSIALFIDWIELLADRVDKAIKVAVPNATLQHYDKVLALGAAAKEQCNFMFEKTSAEYQQAIADNSDELMEKTVEGVKVIMSKM